MGKPLITQRRGKGSPSFRAPSHRFKADASYRSYDEAERGVLKAEVIELIDDPGRNGILMRLRYETGDEAVVPAAEGICVGDHIEEGVEAKPGIGHIMPLGRIPEGYPIFNIERTVGDGGATARSSGCVAFVVSKTDGRVLVKMPSGKMAYYNAMCRATIGCAAGGGRTEKPLLKAGKAYHKEKARGHWYPTVRGVAMNAYDHPFGGKEHHGAITPKGEGGAPGQHVGSFGARRTGRRKR